MTFVPGEVDIFGVYMPPLLPAATLGVIAALLTARLLNRSRLSRHFFLPGLVTVALVTVYTALFGTFVFPI